MRSTTFETKNTDMTTPQTVAVLHAVQEEKIREDLVKLHSTFGGEATVFIEVMAMSPAIAVMYERYGGEAAESVPRYDYQWLYQYLEDYPHHAATIVKILNQETADSDKDLPFEWQIHAVEVPA